MLDSPPAAAPEPSTPKAFVPTEADYFTVETVTEGLEVPWSIEFLPDGAMLVAKRPGRLRIVRERQLERQPIAGLPVITAQGEGGLMDIALLCLLHQAP